jgi:hypothetical protein
MPRKSFFAGFFLGGVGLADTLGVSQYAKLASAEFASQMELCFNKILME